jgi:putative tryptophan/tyrosine transport system substrate-binding protein
VTLQSHEVKGPKDFEVAFARMTEERLDALFVLDDALTIQYRKEIADFATQKRLPSVFCSQGSR